LTLLLGAGTFVVFQPMLTHDFLQIDDPVYVTDNVFVLKGLSMAGIQWAFTTLHAEFYHPLTWLSLMLDTHLFGTDPTGYLFSNLILHIINTLLVFAVFVQLTQKPLHSAIVAMLFAIHPLHVESVAWIAARKDVLSAFFWMLTLRCYLAYVKKPNPGRYICVHLAYLLGLLAKPMLVTLPIILLILDFWPLERYQRVTPKTENRMGLCFRMVKEKLLLFFFSAGAGILAIIAQQHGGGLDVMQDFSLGQRLSNALVTIPVYIFRTIWPDHLAVFYPFPLEIPFFQVFGSLGCIIAITFVCIRFRHRYPYVTVGWLWYLVTLLPVLGILKVGGFASADRYTYIPIIGLFMLVTWGVTDLFKRTRYQKPLSAGLVGIIVLSLFLKTSLQLQNWSDSQTLFTHAVTVTRANDFAHHGLGHIYAADNAFKKATAHFQTALRINPDRYITQKDLARLLVYQGKFKQGDIYLKQLLTRQPDYGAAHYAFGLMLALQKRYPEAASHILKGFRLHPQYRAVQKRRGDTGPASELYAQGQQDAAAGHHDRARKVFEHVLDLDRQFHPARMGLAETKTDDKCKECTLILFLGNLSESNLKRLLAAGYRKWPVFSDAKTKPI